MACTEMNRVLAVNMSRRLGIENTVAQGLVNRLEKEGCIKAPGKGKRLRHGSLLLNINIIQTMYNLNTDAECRKVSSKIRNEVVISRVFLLSTR